MDSVTFPRSPPSPIQPASALVIQRWDVCTLDQTAIYSEYSGVWFPFTFSWFGIHYLAKLLWDKLCSPNCLLFNYLPKLAFLGWGSASEFSLSRFHLLLDFLNLKSDSANNGCGICPLGFLGST